MTTLTIQTTNFRGLWFEKLCSDNGVKIIAKSITVPPKVKPKKTQKQKSLHELFVIVCLYLKVDAHKAISKSRKRELAYARQLFFFLTIEHTQNVSLGSIGRFTSGRDHATVIHGRQVIKDFISWKHTATGKKVQNDINEITKLINL